ncbi:uncharacterized protein DEA37_0006428 [Paragonimus westermani]|uniref:Uncharacterized protein n=1 Tax=Paragonimus westermani TaxID=34504 RepID=A0A5J4N4M9_9TREM|nr:uncharacterized protein DEA37_0010764 [Paragonimus westermani]KAA3670493.1 uncharacterized protein DEA37_0006428 [Paragonimus westermani]
MRPHKRVAIISATVIISLDETSECVQLIFNINVKRPIICSSDDVESLFTNLLFDKVSHIIYNYATGHNLIFGIHIGELPELLKIRTSDSQFMLNNTLELQWNVH